MTSPAAIAESLNPEDMALLRKLATGRKVRVGVLSSLRDRDLAQWDTEEKLSFSCVITPLGRQVAEHLEDPNGPTT